MFSLLSSHHLLTPFANLQPHKPKYIVHLWLFPLFIISLPLFFFFTLPVCQSWKHWPLSVSAEEEPLDLKTNLSLWTSPLPMPLNPPALVARVTFNLSPPPKQTGHDPLPASRSRRGLLTRQEEKDADGNQRHC